MSTARTSQIKAQSRRIQLDATSWDQSIKFIFSTIILVLIPNMPATLQGNFESLIKTLVWTIPIGGISYYFVKQKKLPLIPHLIWVWVCFTCQTLALTFGIFVTTQMGPHGRPVTEWLIAVPMFAAFSLAFVLLGHFLKWIGFDLPAKHKLKQ